MSLLSLLLAVALSPFRGVAGPCDLAESERDYIISGYVNSDVFIGTGERVLIINAEINGKIELMTGAEVTHVSIVDSLVNGDVIAEPLDGDGDASICIQGGADGTAISGSVDVEKSKGDSVINIRNNVEIFGSVSLDKSNEGDAPPSCGGELIIRGDNDYSPILHGGGSAAGACSVDVRGAILNSDFETDGTTGDVMFNSVAISGDFQIQNSIDDVFIENVDSTSDISVDGANHVEWRNGQGTDGDAGFSHINSLLVDDVGNISPVNGLLSIGPVDNATITMSAFKSGIEVDLVRDLTITDILLPEGGLTVDGDIVNGIYMSEKVVLERNYLGNGSLVVADVSDVTIRDNTIENGNLTIVNSQTCDVSENSVPKGNIETSGCNGSGGGGDDDTEECSCTLDNSNFPGGGELSNNQFYWCDEDKVYGPNGEVQAGDGSSTSFPTRRAAKNDAKANLSNDKAYSTAKWKQNLGTWKKEKDHLTP